MTQMGDFPRGMELEFLPDRREVRNSKGVYDNIVQFLW